MLFGLAGGHLLAAGREQGLRTASEVFADRGYRPDGTLVPRDAPGAILSDPAEVIARAVRMVREGRVSAISLGKERPKDPGHDEQAWAKNRRAHFALSR